ncbi:MAG: NAD(P)-binding protein [Desulfomonilaceae bacterium]
MTEKIGAIMTVGGGIGGVQASLDLAESGFKVYLVEEKAGIGGVMAQLDKTFPTNDCSACIFSPKLVTVGQNPNIEILAYSQVEGIEGEPGDFRVKVRKKTRYIDVDKCKNCGDCAVACPVTLPDEYNERLSERKAVYRLFPQTIPQAFVIDKGDRAPCVAECPAGINVQGYVQLVKQGKYQQAIELIMEKLPLPGVLGRVCPHPCEGACRRGLKDSPVSIRNLKRVAADNVDYKDLPRPEISPKEGKVAVVGSGPAGLSAAYYLALEGYACTIFESAPVLGGMLRLGIPKYRLPREVLDAEIQYILSYGIEVRTNTSLGKDISLDELRAQFNAVYLAIGCHKGSRMDIAGEDSPGVVQAVSFLRDAELNQEVKVGRSVAVIGGGNAALDAARTSLRLGAEQVSILYRRTRAEMPAWEEEIEAALEENIKINFLVAPVEVLHENGSIKGLKCIKMQLGEPDRSGRRRPVPIQGSEFVFQTDMVISAIGQQIDSEFWDRMTGLNSSARNTIKADPLTYETNVEGVFAGGDAASGPATVVEAVGAGREAAISICRFLAGQDVRAGRTSRKEKKQQARDFVYPPIPKMPEQLRMQPVYMQANDRVANFNEVESALSVEAATKEAERCLNCGLCSECMECVRACPAQAVNHSMEDEVLEVRVGAVILTPGFEVANPEKVRGEYAYGRAANVVTNVQFERILSASGPFGGEVRRPSDNKHPRKVAWIQCVASRDRSKGMPHCSSVCCMASIKEAVIAKEHDSSVEPTIFFMDIRAYGKDFDKYYERAKNSGGVRFIRSMVSRVVEDPITKDLQLTYVSENSQLITETFDMVVLAVGIKPSESTLETARILNVGLDENQFCATSTFDPVGTTRPGIFVAGAFQAPKDIPQTVMEASAAAGVAVRQLADQRDTLTTKKQLPPEKNVAGQKPRIGVFVCRCGINIASTVNVSGVVERVRTLPDVAYVEENMFTCSLDTQNNIKKLIEENNLNRVIVASCTPRTHLPLFQETAREAGLNKYLVEMANIREHCSWVHMQEKELATEKAVDLIRMAVARSRLLEQVQDQQLGMIQSALVIGGGVAGMIAALNLADQGFPVHLVEASDKLGGNALRLHHTTKGEEVRPYLDELVHKITSSDKISTYFNSAIEDVQGFIGSFKTKIASGGSQPVEVEHGVAVVATGASEWKPDMYGYGSDPRIRTHLEMSEAMKAQDPAVMKAGTTVFIQCVGSRCQERPWCSKVCCNHTVKDAIALKEANPNANIYVLYRDIRTYGLNEPYYEQARRMGVVFVRYEPEAPPVVEPGQKIVVRVEDLVLGGTMTLEADSLVLAAAVIPNPFNKELARMFKISTNEDGFFLEAHMKLRPVDFATDGVFLAGLAHYPKPLDETIAQAEAAASHAAQALARGYVDAPGMVSFVDEFLCRGCGRCVDVCPFHAPELKEVAPGVMKSEVNPALCKGCGACGVACPTGAAAVRHFKDEQVGDMIEAALS